MVTNQANILKQYHVLNFKSENIKKYSSPGGLFFTTDLLPFILGNNANITGGLKLMATPPHYE